MLLSSFRCERALAKSLQASPNKHDGSTFKFQKKGKCSHLRKLKIKLSKQQCVWSGQARLLMSVGWMTVQNAGQHISAFYTCTRET
jgi:hypothetical protein